MSLHGELFDGSIPGPPGEGIWPGYDKLPAPVRKLGLLARLFRRRTPPRHAA
jgi:hypothetical protein